MKAWVVKCRENRVDNIEGWHWDRYFDGDNDAGWNWGGSDWIRSNESKKYIREQVTKGDLVICYQYEGRQIVGLTRMKTDGAEEEPGSNEYNVLNFVSPKQSLRLDSPLSIQKLRETGCNPKCFGPGRQGTIFPIEAKELNSIVSAIGRNSQIDGKKLSEWLKKIGYADTHGFAGKKLTASIGTRDSGFPDPATTKKIEKVAVNFVTAILEDEGWNVKSVEPDKCGYDLLCLKGKKELNVEVKGTSGKEVHFTITASEAQQAKVNPHFMLYIVTDILSRGPEMHTWTGVDFLRDFALSPIQYNARPKLTTK